MKKRFFLLLLAVITMTFVLAFICSCDKKAADTTAEQTLGIPAETTAKESITTVITTKDSSQTTKKPDTTKYPTLDVLPDMKPLALKWDEGQIFPTFPSVGKELDVINGKGVSLEEQIALTALQGIVNANGIRLVMFVDKVEEWTRSCGYTVKEKASTMEERYAMIKKYSSEITGVVLYSDKQADKYSDYVNLATTIGGIKRAIPVSENIYKRWQRGGIELPVVEDLTGMTATTKTEIYSYLYDNYWKDCTKRLLIVQSPTLAQMRDYASATGAAVVHLSCASSDKTEKALFEKFCADMTPGESIMMGWNGQERELMTTVAKHGLSCVPADFFSAPSVFANDSYVTVNEVPDMPPLENKIYIAFYMSDGDNIQYNMNAMKEYWYNSTAARGKVALNWTISPALLEVAPGMMNYYYSTATEKDCFVCGPSGLGYTFPMNTFGPNTGVNFKNEEYFTKYVEMTNKYLARAGLRTVTIWDNLSAMQRNVYTKFGTYLYGLTVHNFTNGSLNIGLTRVENDTLIQQLTPGYFAKNAEGTTTLREMGDIDAAISYLRYDKSAPIFISCQVSVWAFNNVDEIVEFERYLSEKYAEKYGEDVIEFVRADHYYNLYYRANGLPYDLTLRSDIKVSASSGEESAKNLCDGSHSTLWQADEKGEQSVTVDLGNLYDLTEISVFFAEMADKAYSSEDNLKSIIIEISRDGEQYELFGEISDNTSEWINVKPEGDSLQRGRYVKITVPCTDNEIARIADVNIIGKDVK